MHLFFTTFDDDWRRTFEWAFCLFGSFVSVYFVCWWLRTLDLFLFSLVNLRGGSRSSLDWSRTFGPWKVSFVNWSVFPCYLNVKNWLTLENTWLLLHCPLLHWFIHHWVVLTCLIEFLDKIFDALNLISFHLFLRILFCFYFNLNFWFLFLLLILIVI